MRDMEQEVWYVTRRATPIWAWGVMLTLCLSFPGPLRAETQDETRSRQAAEYNSAGVDYYNAGQWDNAIAQFERAHELSSDNETVRRNLCNAYQAAAGELAKSADFAAAAKHLENAISVDPKNASPLMQLGSYYLRLDMVGDAIFRLEEAIELAAQDLDAHELLGDAYYKDNDLAAARVQWEWVLEMAPARPNLGAKIEKAKREESVEQDFRRSDSRHFNLSFPQGAPAQSLGNLLSHLERAYLEIGRKFGGVFPPTPIQVIVYSSADFMGVTQQGRHVGAIYDGKIRVPLMDEQKNVLDDQELKHRLYHEYTHVVVRFLAAGNVPGWLNEGLAETFSRDLDGQRIALLRQAYQQGALFSLAGLSDIQLAQRDPTSLQLAYCQSHATVNYLWSRFGQRPLRAMMSSLAEGMNPEEALKTHYRYSYETLRNEVNRALFQPGQ